MQPAGYLTVSRAEWARLRSNTALTLSEADLAPLRGSNEQVSLDEVEEVYLPLSRLLNLQVRAARHLNGVKDVFLGRLVGSRSYVIAIAGSVAVGKSTFARVLQALMARWPDHPHVELVATDGILQPNRVLLANGLMQRKGFPESHDPRRMVQFLADIKAGAAEVSAPFYSHQAYDIAPAEWQVVRQPDVLIFEGLNVLRTAGGTRRHSVIVSDFFDYALYVDAGEADIERWYVERFLPRQRTSFQNPNSYFHHLKDLPPDQAREAGRRIWREINRVNLEENILPTLERGNVVLRKRADHGIGDIWLRQL